MESGSQDNGSNGTSDKPPQTTFMFIDSTTQGANMKPNKAVRSFVMHKARSNRPWSTRKPGAAPAAEREANTGRKRSRRQPTRRADKTSPEHFGSELDPSTRELRTSQKAGSTPSTISSRRNSSRPSGTPSSSHSSTSCPPDCNGDCSPIHTGLARRDVCAVGVIDPFDCLAVKLDARMSHLIEHFAENMCSLCIPIDIHRSSSIVKTGWMANALSGATSEPFAFAILTSSALHQQIFGVNHADSALYYKTRAISGINKNLSDVKASTDDNNIAAVFMLLNLEESQLVAGNTNNANDWTEKQREIHLNGLQTMIQQRGGLAGLESNRCLQVFILMHSIAHSIASFQRPYAVLLDGNGEPQKYDLPSFRSRPASARIVRLFRDLKPDRKLMEITLNLIPFTGDLNAWFEDARCPANPLELQKHALLLIYRLFHWYTEPDEVRQSTDQCLCLAQLIFLVIAAHPNDLASRAMTWTAVKKLRAALKATSIFRWAKSTDLLLWTLTLGALAAQGSPEADFFTQYCTMAFAGAGFDERTTTEELLDRMQKCLWIPCLLDKEVRHLWVKIGLAKEEVVEDVLDKGMLSPDLKEEDAIGTMTSNRFFSK